MDILLDIMKVARLLYVVDPPRAYTASQRERLSQAFTILHGVHLEREAETIAGL